MKKALQTELIAISEKIRILLKDELGVAVGNMEVLSFTEKIHRLISTNAYNDGLRSAQNVIEKKTEDINEQILSLFKDEE